MDVSRLYYHKLISINKSVEKVNMVFEGSALFPQNFIVEFRGFSFETTSFVLGKQLIRCCDSSTLGIKSIDFLNKKMTSNYHNYRQLTLEFEPDGFYKNEVICLYEFNHFHIQSYS